MINHTLEWPSLTVQWLPINEVNDNPDTDTHKLLLGTNAPKGQKNSLIVATVATPKDTVALHMDEYNYDIDKKDGFFAIG